MFPGSFFHLEDVKWREKVFCFEDFDASLDSEGIRKRERLRIFRKLEVLDSNCCRQLWEWGLTRVADASGTCSGGEQAEEEDKRRKRSCGGKQHWGSSSRSCLYSSVDGFAAGFCQRVWGWCCGAFACTARLLGSSQLRCGKQLLTPDTAWRCESIVPLHSAMQCSACSQRALWIVVWYC